MAVNWPRSSDREEANGESGKLPQEVTYHWNGFLFCSRDRSAAVAVKFTCRLSAEIRSLKTDICGIEKRTGCLDSGGSIVAECLMGTRGLTAWGIEPGINAEWGWTTRKSIEGKIGSKSVVAVIYTRRLMCSAKAVTPLIAARAMLRAAMIYVIFEHKWGQVQVKHAGGIDHGWGRGRGGSRNVRAASHVMLADTAATNVLSAVSSGRRKAEINYLPSSFCLT